MDSQRRQICHVKLWYSSRSNMNFVFFIANNIFMVRWGGDRAKNVLFYRGRILLGATTAVAVPVPEFRWAGTVPVPEGVLCKWQYRSRTLRGNNRSPRTPSTIRSRATTCSRKKKNNPKLITMLWSLYWRYCVKGTIHTVRKTSLGKVGDA